MYIILIVEYKDKGDVIINNYYVQYKEYRRVRFMEAHEFLNYKNWVVVGDVLNTQKYAYRILRSLKGAGFIAEGVNPRSSEENMFKSLRDVPYKIDVMDLCISPVIGIKVMKEASEIGVNKVLIQPGAESREILDYCRESKIDAVEGCALVELSSHIM